MSDVLAELQAELHGVAPSPEFAVRVRARIESRARRARWRVCAVVAGAAAVIAALALQMSGSGRGADTLPAAPRLATVAPRSPAPSVPSVPPWLQPRRAAAIVTPSRRPRVDVAPHGPDVRFDVITTQAAVLQQLWRHATRQDGEPAEAPALPEPATSVDADGRLIVRELVVDPIVVPPIGGGPGGQGRVQRLLSPQATGSPK
jgi:hypothetical protein